MKQFNWKPVVFLLTLVFLVSACGVSKKEHEALKVEKQELEIQINKLAEEVNTLKLRVDELIKDKGDLDARITELSLENTDLKTRLNQVEKARKAASRSTATKTRKKAA